MNGENVGSVVVNTDGGMVVAASFNCNRLAVSDRRAILSHEKQIAEHQFKLDAYRRNPYNNDNKGFLKNAQSEEIKRRIIDGRIRHLQKEIKNSQQEIEDIFNGG